MDVIPLPERKKLNFLRAKKEQLDVLMAGFSISDVSSKPHIEALAASTGLPYKWIISWFTRQRKKVSTTTTSGRVRRRKNAIDDAANKDQKDVHNDITSTTAMSINEIAVFKSERGEPALSKTLGPMIDSEMEQKPVISKNAEKKTGNPGRKRNQDPNLRGHASPLKSAFVTAPLPARSEPSTSEESSFQAQAQPAECASPTSTFILREMVPVTYKYGDSLENESVAPASTCDTGTSVAQISDLWAAPSLDAFDDGLQLPATSNDHLTPSAPSDSSSPVRVFSLEESALFETTRQRNTVVTEQAASKRMQDLRHSRSKASIPPPPDAPKSRPRTLRTILPSNIPFSNTVSAPQHLFFYSSDTKENTMIPPQRLTRSKLRSSGPRVLPPLFANTDLRNLADRQTMPYSASLSASSPTTVSKLPTQIFEEPFEVPNLWPLDEGLGPTQINDQMDHDYTSAPLKYLDVLAPFSDEGLPGNDIMNRLLEPDLVEHDPFQAAMGLVFVSQLGVHWDYS